MLAQKASAAATTSALLVMVRLCACSCLPASEYAESGRLCCWATSSESTKLTDTCSAQASQGFLKMITDAKAATHSVLLAIHKSEMH